jgi:hypothetical protein
MAFPADSFVGIPVAQSLVERAMVYGEADGFAALYTHNGVIVGATYAGEPLPLLTLAVAQK